MEAFRTLFENKQKQQMKVFLKENTYTEEMLNLMAVSIIKNYSKDDDDTIKMILRSKLGETENAMNLKIRLATFLNKDEVIKVYKLMIENNVLIKNRTLSPMIEFAISIDDLDWLNSLYQIVLERDICLTQNTYYSILNYLGNKGLSTEFDSVVKDLVYFHEVISEKIGDILCHFYSFRVQECHIGRNHKCKKCNTVFHQPKMSREEQRFIKETIQFDIVKNNPKFTSFIKFLENRLYITENVDYIIDGANVGYYEQRPDLGGRLSYKNIDILVNQLQGKKLIFLHSNHDRNNIYVKKWKARNMVYFTPRGMNDDWFWLYFAIHSLKSKIISNDKICDHYYKCFHSKSFMKWRDLTMITFKFSQNRFILKDCKPYRMETQYSQLKWHIPLQNKKWLCIDA